MPRLGVRPRARLADSGRLGLQRPQLAFDPGGDTLDHFRKLGIANRRRAEKFQQIAAGGIRQAHQPCEQAWIDHTHGVIP